MSTTEQTTPESQIVAMYRWATWVHVGPGAEGCEDIDEVAGRNDCANPLHFHAWCRLPNQYQHRDIRERAMAAKARRVRALRDTDSDASVIMEEELDTLARVGDRAIPDIVEELLAKDWWRDYMEAAAEVRESELDDGTKPFEHIDADMERWRELSELPADDRAAEYEELEKHITGFNEKIDAAREAIMQPRKDALLAQDINALIDLLRDQRVDMDANQAFLHEYSTQEWLTCTRRTPPDGPLVWASREHLERADEAVIDAVKDTYTDLERTQSADSQGGAPGN